MLYQARQARTASRFAPALTRRAAAQAWIFGRYSPAILLWMDAYRSEQAAGTTVDTATDSSGRSVSITQGTGSKQPLSAVRNGIKAFQFDGVNDCLQTAVLPLGGQQVSIVAMSQQVSGTAIIAEAGPGTAGITDAVTHSRGDTFVRNVVGFFAGNVGLQYKLSTSGYTDWIQAAVICNKGAPAATEMLIRVDNVQPALSVTTSENTNTFGNYGWNLGSRNNGAVAPLNGWISQVLVFNIALPAEAQEDIYRTLQQLVGRGWL